MQGQVSERGVDEAARGKASEPGPGVRYGAIIMANLNRRVEINKKWGEL